jgi:predicted PurR-regulated permease PerM
MPMIDSTNDGRNHDLLRKATEVAIRLFLVAGLTYWCFLIFQPFLLPLVFGIVLAVALSPAYSWLESRLGGRRKLATTLFIVVGIGALAVPTYLISESFLEGVTWLSAQVRQEAIHVPPPPAGVADWPVIGDQVHQLWTHASVSLEATLTEFGPQVKGFASWLLSTLTGVGFGFLIMIVAIVLAGVILMHSEGGGRTAHAIGARLGGEQGKTAIDLATETIRSVATGVVGVAVVQAVLAAIGLLLAGVPAAGLWAVLVLILAVAQLPPLVILGPAIFFVLGTSDSTLTMVLFTIWSLFVSVSDIFLKPMFLGRGMTIPMPVILIGAIGGVVRSGIVGLFVGAVVLAIGYKMFMAWMKQAEAS